MITKFFKGFTLLEVLVALIFFSLIGLVLQEVTASTVSAYLKVRDNTYAEWIAENKLAALRLSEGLPSPREYKEELEFGVDEWQILTTVIKTENPDIMRAEVSVLQRNSETNEFVKRRSLSGFIGRY